MGHRIELFPHLRRLFRRHVSGGGVALLVAGLLAGGVGSDPANNQVHLLFGAMVGMFLASLLLGGFWRIRQRDVWWNWHVPPRVVCGGRLNVDLVVENRSARGLWDVEVALTERPRSFGLSGPAFDRLRGLGPGQSMQFQRTFTPSHRGCYRLPAPIVSSVFPLGLIRWGFMPDSNRTVMVTPEVHPVQTMALAPGLRYQAGGLPLASATGESMELLGVREYRSGDAMRKIHWKLWARRGQPVVREFQQEYFSRVALIVDTFLPRRVDKAHRAGFEAAVTTAASVASALAQQESVLDIFAAGPEVYFLTVGRQLGFIHNVLDVLACVEPCHEKPFEKLRALIGEHLVRVTAVLVVLMDLDADRLALLHAIRQSGVWLKVLLVRETAPTLAPADHPELSENWKTLHPAKLAADLKAL